MSHPAGPNEPKSSFLSLLSPWLIALILLSVGPAEEIFGQPGERITLEGTVFDADTGEPIPFATIQVEGTGQATLANAEGRYRLQLARRPVTLNFSHIAYYSETVDLTLDANLSYDVHLKSNLVDLGTMSVYSRRLDPGQQIIMEAIKRKADILARIHDYRYDAYVKLVVSDESKPDSSRIILLTESQTSAYWEQPDKYKEVITSRRQSANLDAENNLVTVGRILNFNQNRIEIGHYSLVSPTADDALDHYNYYLMDTVYIDSLPVFVLEIEPGDQNEPLFAGHIHVASETYDVVRVEVGFSPGVELSLLNEPRYSQRFARFENEYWMPIEIRFSTGLELKVPLPGIPSKMQLDHVASLHRFEFDQGHPGGTFDEFVIEVDQEADEIDSLAWAADQRIPLTTVEIEALHRIDSLEALPPTPGKIALKTLGLTMFILAGGQDNFFRFNRVEGPYLGIGLTTTLFDPNLKLRFAPGYAFDAKKGEQQIGLTYRLSQRRRWDLSFDFHNRVVRRPTVISPPDYSVTFQAIGGGFDPLDYHWIRGFEARTSFKLINHTLLSLGYTDFEMRSMPFATNYTFFGDGSDPIRDNPPIQEGYLRAVSAEFQYDSRKMFKNKGREMRNDEVVFTRLKAGVEYASPDFIDNDFYYKRYHFDLRTRQRTLGLGLTTLRLFGGESEGRLPPQRQFVVDYGYDLLGDVDGFGTLDEQNFGGDRALAITLKHSFRSRLFTGSGLPLVKHIPFWLSVHGGIFWSEYARTPETAGALPLPAAGKPYRDLGFGLGNLTPFMTPFNLAVYFTWQLSDYDTSDFTWFIGIDL